MNGPIPTRVDGAVKAALLALVEDAVAAGWPSRICGLLEIDRARAWRWRTRQLSGRLDDGPPGGNPVHGLLDGEEAEILALFEEWGPVDLSHRKLAHRGSYLERVFVSPSSVDRILALPGAPRPGRSAKKPWPDWVQWRPNQLLCGFTFGVLAETGGHHRTRRPRPTTTTSNRSMPPPRPSAPGNDAAPVGGTNRQRRRSSAGNLTRQRRPRA